ncbi:LacI family DNA-binding transcriptional regulator [Cellulomonas triticagri]|uniref:LacI family transcriptional regulator n=1 Tax=Cellulomonas triticagri TaxID=2483352 RepID=A0A3M2JKG5_9CELL|nr:LacI family DNA-binding transcriptional regulator [Cellulomonas triticagri]RMI14322.1 LacI family transcriptional regulator [Cellulomonas triticagri]
MGVRAIRSGLTPTTSVHRAAAFASTRGAVRGSHPGSVSAVLGWRPCRPTTSAPPPLAVVAADAGVSVPTVSKVLNSRPDVAPTTRERVSAALARHGYAVRPSGGRRTGFVDLRVHDLDSAWAEGVVRGAARAARRLGADLVVTVDPHADAASAGSWVRHALARGTDALVGVVGVPDPAARVAAAQAGVPLVVVDPRVPGDADLRVVGATNFRGGLDATAHLLGLGHRRVATITGPQDQDNAVARLAGYRTALIQAGLPADDDLVRGGAFGVEAGFRAAEVLLGLDDPPTAVFAASDDTAIGVLRAAREHGVRVPQDLSVVGFDDLPVAAWLDPALTTVRQPLTEMGDAAVVLAHRARAGEPVGRHLELATTLVERASTAPPPRGGG